LPQLPPVTTATATAPEGAATKHHKDKNDADKDHIDEGS
jgi:hypothetical protein